MGWTWSSWKEHHLGDKFSFQLLHVQPITHLLCGLTQAGEPLWISRSLSQDYGEQLAAQQSLENADLHVLLDQRIHPLSVGAVAPFDPKKGLDSQAVLGHLARYVSALLALDGQSVPKELVLSPEQVEELTRTLYGWSGFSDTESDCYDQEAQVYRLKGVDLSQEVQLRTVSKLPQFVEVGGSPACMLSYSYVDSDGETTLVEEVYFQMCIRDRNRGGPGGQPQHTVGLCQHLGGKQGRRSLANGLGALIDMDFHGPPTPIACIFDRQATPAACAANANGEKVGFSWVLMPGRPGSRPPPRR